MELYDVMHTTFAAREFTSDPVPDEVVATLLDHARFAPSGGNRQGWRVVVVRDRATRRTLAELTREPAKRYTAQVKAGENPWNTIDAPGMDAATIARTEPSARLITPVLDADAVLVVCVDLKVVAAVDQNLPRVGIVGGASVYPFAWNLMTCARAEGWGTNITTLAIAEEPKLKALLGIPDHVAVAAIMPVGRPVKQLTKLRRKTVPEFAMRERWGGAPFGA